MSTVEREKTLRQFFKHRRLELGITGEEVSTALGRSPGFMEKLESGRFILHPRTLRGISKALDLDEDLILDYHRGKIKELPNGEFTTKTVLLLNILKLLEEKTYEELKEIHNELKGEE